jgi:RNA polymerase sigma factor for flagellar operon FliA
MCAYHLDSERSNKVETIRLRQRSFLPEGNPKQSSGYGGKAHVLPATLLESRDATAPGRDQKVIELLPLLHRIARKMRAHLPSHVEVDDLVGAGALGLIDAVRKFDVKRKIKLESYAQHRIRGAIIDSLRAMDGASRDMRKKNKKAEESYRELESSLGRPPTDDEMARAGGISLKAWHRTIRDLQPLGVEWLRPADSSGQQYFTEETIPAEYTHDQVDLCYLREQREVLNRALAALPGRDRRIIWLYYVRELTMKQIGEELGIDESRVSQLHSATLLRLRSAVTTLLRAPQHSAVLCDEYQNLKAA